MVFPLPAAHGWLLFPVRQYNMKPERATRRQAVFGVPEVCSQQKKRLSPRRPSFQGVCREGRSPLDVPSNPAACTPDLAFPPKGRACPADGESAQKPVSARKSPQGFEETGSVPNAKERCEADFLCACRRCRHAERLSPHVIIFPECRSLPLFHPPSGRAETCGYLLSSTLKEA